jgi:hypothetical protein
VSNATEAPAVAESGSPLQLLTTSSAKKFSRCNREYKLSVVDGYAPVATAAALRFGTLIHLGLESWWKSVTPEERLPAALAAVQPAIGETADPFDLVRVEELLIGYDARWGAEPLTALAVEVEFRAPLLNPETGKPSRTFQRAGKCDGIVQQPDGRVQIIEHKTSSEDITPGGNYWRRLQIDSQISNYYAGARALGYDVTGCLYDVLGKPTIKPYKATPEADRKFTKAGALYANQRETDETPDEFRARLREKIAADPMHFFQRGEVVRLEDEEVEAAFDVWQIGKALLEAQNANRWPRNADACVRFGQTCSFFDVCTRTASLDDPSLFQRKAAHSELTVSLSLSSGDVP